MCIFSLSMLFQVRQNEKTNFSSSIYHCKVMTFNVQSVIGSCCIFDDETLQPSNHERCKVNFICPLILTSNSFQCLFFDEHITLFNDHHLYVQMNIQLRTRFNCFCPCNWPRTNVTTDITCLTASFLTSRRWLHGPRNKKVKCAMSK